MPLASDVKCGLLRSRTSSSNPRCSSHQCVTTHFSDWFYLYHLIDAAVKPLVEVRRLGMQPEKQCAESGMINLGNKWSLGKTADLGLPCEGFIVCSAITSLALRPVSLMICKLRRIFRVSRQCHRLLVMGSSSSNKAYNFHAASDSFEAGGCSGRLVNSSRVSFSRQETERDMESDCC